MTRHPLDLARVPAQARRPLGRVLQAVAVLGVAVAIGVAIVGWQVLGDLDDVAGESTAVTGDALQALEQTLDLAADLVESVDTTLDAVETGLASSAASVQEGADALDSVTRLADDAAPALGSATETLRALERVGTTLDSTLGALASLPLAPDYDPEQGFGATVGELADDLEPLSDSFAATADDLRGVTAETAELEGDLQDLTTSVAATNERLGRAEGLLEDYRETATRAGALAETTGAGLGADLWLLRVLVVLGALVLGVGQLVPWLVAAALLDEGADAASAG